MFDFERSAGDGVPAILEPARPQSIVVRSATAGRISEQVTAADQLEAAICISAESLRITEGQVDIRLSAIGIQIGDGDPVVVACANLVTVPGTACVSRCSCEQLVVIEVHGFGLQAQALQVEHLRMGHHIHEETHVSSREILGENAVLTQRLDARLVVALRHGLTATEGFFSVRRRHRSVWGCAQIANPRRQCRTAQSLMRDLASKRQLAVDTLSLLAELH